MIFLISLHVIVTLIPRRILTFALLNFDMKISHYVRQKVHVRLQIQKGDSVSCRTYP